MWSRVPYEYSPNRLITVLRNRQNETHLSCLQTSDRSGRLARYLVRSSRGWHAGGNRQRMSGWAGRRNTVQSTVESEVASQLLHKWPLDQSRRDRAIPLAFPDAQISRSAATMAKCPEHRSERRSSTTEKVLYRQLSHYSHLAGPVVVTCTTGCRQNTWSRHHR